MPKSIGVTLQKSGDYWQIGYRDSAGKRRTKSLRHMGPRSKVSKRAAQREADRFAIELGSDPRLRDRGQPPNLSKWTAYYLKLREPEIGEKTWMLYRTTARKLVEHFGTSASVAAVTPAAADEWRSEMVRSGLSDETVRAHTRRATTMFNKLVQHNQVAANPFNGMPKASRAAGQHGDVDASMIPKLLDACPDARWRTLIALTCYAGLRLGESQIITWDAIRWGKGKLIAPSPKTSKSTGRRSREVRMEPELEAVLAECHEQAKPGEVAIVGGRNRSSSQRRKMLEIVARAGIEPYPRPFHSWRSWRASTWKKIHPEYVVNLWMGHSQAVSNRHYTNQVPEEFYGSGESEIQRLRRENEELRRRCGNPAAATVG